VQFTHENVEEDADALATANESSMVFDVKGAGCIRVNLNISATQVGGVRT
jgi:hypothetical protein